MNKLLVFWLAVLLLFSGAALAWYAVNLGGRGPSSGQDNVVDYGPPLEHFQLTQSTGEQFDSRTLDGQIWIANFFYSSCPAVCLRENMAVHKLEREFGGRGVKFVSITVKPATDTPQRLADYAERNFNADPQRWFFLTGDMGYIQRIGEDIFQTTVQPGGHTESLFVIDRQGEIKGIFNFQNPVEMRELRSLVNQLLLEPSVDDPASPADESPAESTEPAGGDVTAVVAGATSAS